MKSLKTPFAIIGITYFIYGIVMNIKMYLDQSWPTYLYLIWMGVGITLLVVNKWTQKLPIYRVWQVLIGVLPVVTFYFYISSQDIYYQKESISKSIELKPTTSLKSGDIIFQTSKSSQSQAIQLATKSKYSHMGIVYNINGKYFVYEAVQPVKLTPLNKWIKRGVNNHYVVKRLKESEEILTPETLSKMKEVGEQFKGKNYDIYFEWSDSKIYCSELVWKIYKESTGIEIGELQSLSDFDLSSESVKSIMKKRYGNNIPLDEKVISPESMFNSGYLITIDEK